MTTSIKLVSTDFDGTIFAEFENPPMPRVLQDLLGDLQAGGVRWVINTGREMSGLLEALGRAQVRVHPDYLVLVEREIYRRVHAEYVPLADWNTASQRAHAELFERLGPHLPALVGWIEERFEATLYANAWSPLCLIAANNGDADHIEAHMRAFCRTVPKLDWVRNDVYGRFGHADFNKGTALVEIRRQLGLEAAEVFAAGDHLNDLPMLDARVAAHLGAPANAAEPVRRAVLAAGGCVGSRPHGHGVAEVLARLVGWRRGGLD